jgi:HK97 family phage major capsid protein
MPFAPTIAPDADLAEVRTQLVAAARYAMELRTRPAEEQGTDDHRADLRSAVDFIHTFDSIERALAAGERSARDAAEIEARTRGEARGPSAAFTDLDRERRSAGEQVTADTAYAEWATGGTRGAFPHVEVRNLLSSVSGDGGVFRPVGTPQLYPGAIQQRKMWLRDVLSVQETGLSSVPYIREVNASGLEGGASAVAEASAKPEVTMNFVQADAPVRKIAGWLVATDEILMDAPTLKGYIDTRLGYMVAVREEAEILNGTGTAPRLEGINVVTGTQTQTTPTGDYPAIIGRAIGKVENVDGEADAVATNPLDYWTAITSRFATQFDNSGSGSAPAVFGGVTWGLPAIRTRAMTGGSAIVGAWRLGATLFDRMQTVVRTADQHDDLFIKNQVVILAEERVALAIHRPALFVKATVPIGS